MNFSIVHDLVFTEAGLEPPTPFSSRRGQPPDWKRTGRQRSPSHEKEDRVLLRNRGLLHIRPIVRYGNFMEGNDNLMEGVDHIPRPRVRHHEGRRRPHCI